MVAGMVMPIADLRAIYELLFRDGVMVTKKDQRPQSMHPELPGVANLRVIRAMGSLKSRGFVRETFAWKHGYFYLTNEGIVYLRDYLRLPPEIIPSSLQRVRRPASTLDVMRRAARVQTVDGPTSYVPKPRAGGESHEGMMDRQGYRHKRDGEEEGQSDRPPMRFRGSYQPRGPGGEPGVQTQTFFRRGQGPRRGEERAPEEGQKRGFRTSYLPPESRAVRPPAPTREVQPAAPKPPVSTPIVPPIPQEVAVAVVEQIMEAVAPSEFIPEVVKQEASAESALVGETVEQVPEVVEEVTAEAPVAEMPESAEEKEEEEEEEEDNDADDDDDDDDDYEEEEDEEEVHEEELITEEPVAEVVLEVQVEEDLQPALKLAADDAPAPEEPAVPEETVEEDDMVEIEPAPVAKESAEELVVEEEVTDIAETENLEEPEQPEPVTVALDVEAEREPVTTTEAIEVKTAVAMTKAVSPGLDSDLDLPTPPPPVTEDFTDLTEETVVERDTHQEVFTSEMTLQMTQQVVTPVEETVETQVISQSHAIMEPPMAVDSVVSELGLVQEQSATAFQAGFDATAMASECPIAALKSSLPQGDWGFLTEDPEEEQEVKKVWPDSFEG